MHSGFFGCHLFFHGVKCRKERLMTVAIITL